MTNQMVTIDNTVIYGRNLNVKRLYNHLQFLLTLGLVKRCVFDGQKGFVVEFTTKAVQQEFEQLISKYT